MSLRKKKTEIQRLIKAFEVEAAKFSDIKFSQYFITQDQDTANLDLKFSQPNHAIMLWQYYGTLGTEKATEKLYKNLINSDLQWGLRGAKLTSYAVIEGESYRLFIKMATRAGNLFSEKERLKIKAGTLEDIQKKESSKGSKPVSVSNDNNIAVWLNYLLHHISMTHPGKEKLQTIEPDPFSLSLLALEHLLENPEIDKTDRSLNNIKDIKFKVALSFPGERRVLVSKIAQYLRDKLGADSLFYDYDYQSQLARPNLDTLLQNIYRNNSELVVIFLCDEYQKKDWCYLEWRAIRDIIKSRDDEKIMFIRLDNANIDGVYSGDGYIDANSHNEKEIANFILERAELSSKTAQ